MGANYLLGGEEQEGGTLLHLEENTSACICFREGKINQSREKAALFTDSHEADISCKVLLSCSENLGWILSKQDVIHTVIPCRSVGKHQRPLVATASPSRVA